MPYHRKSNRLVDKVNAKTRTVYLSLLPPITNTVEMVRAACSCTGQGRHFITVDDVHCTADFLPDEAVDTSPGHLQRLERDAAITLLAHGHNYNA